MNKFIFYKLTYINCSNELQTSMFHSENEVQEFIKNVDKKRICHVVSLEKVYFDGKGNIARRNDE